MPYKNWAQARAMHAKEERGEISPGVVKEFDSASKGMDLPDHSPAVRKWMSKGGKVPRYSGGGYVGENDPEDFLGPIAEVNGFDEDDEEDDERYSSGGRVPKKAGMMALFGGGIGFARALRDRK